MRLNQETNLVQILAERALHVMFRLGEDMSSK